jgi:hypothetical protein
LKAASDDEWEAFNTGIQEASEDLEQAFRQPAEGFQEALSEIN